MKCNLLEWNKDETVWKDLDEKQRFVIYRNKDNLIDYEELCQAMDGISADPPVVSWEIEELFNEADRNKDGKIDIEGL